LLVRYLDIYLFYVYGLDTSQPFAALKQQVNTRSDGSRVLATAVVIGAERQQSSCGGDAKRQRAETTSRILR